MSIKKASYDGMDWVNALKARKDPIDYEAQLASAEESTENVLERTLQAAYSLPTTEETSAQALKRASKEIQDIAAHDTLRAEVVAIKTKLASRDIDPVALGVTSAEKWNDSLDLEWVENVATAAAVAFQTKLAHSWEDKALEVQTTSQSFDPAVSREGKIVGSHSAGDDASRNNAMLPKTANSIFDPFKLDRFALEETEHDKAVQSSRDILAARLAKIAADKEAMVKALPTDQQMNPGKIMSSASISPEVFNPKSPKSQISMTDDLSKKISELFTRVDDNKSKTIEANRERKESIQAKREVDQSWQKMSAPMSTSQKSADLHERLKDLWSTEPKE